MKVLDLQCEQAHAFEGWFGSEADFQSQLASGMLQCPICRSANVAKKLSAPRLNLRASSRRPEVVAASQAGTSDESDRKGDHPPASGSVSPALPVGRLEPGAGHDWQAHFLRAIREVVQKTEDVGDQFTEQARRMHYGEQPAKAIRGKATAADAMALLEEGIDVLPIPDLPGLNGPLQ
ncbi:MAG TPA: DUF1178 family protein [Burkholderiaceae bacterium]|nr:DUF1178 family protein [Burkholderiaceae bacterium]